MIALLDTLHKDAGRENVGKKPLDSFDVLAIFSVALLIATLSLLGMGELTEEGSNARNGDAAPHAETHTPQQQRSKFDRDALAILTPLRTAPTVIQPKVITNAKPVLPLRLAKSIDKTRPFMAEDIKVSFALADDFTGGTQSIHAEAVYKAPKKSPSDDHVYHLKRGESFSDLLKRAGLNPYEIDAATNALGRSVKLRSLKPGAEFTLFKKTPALTLFQRASMAGQTGQVLSTMDYKLDRTETIRLVRRLDGTFKLVRITSGLDKRYIALAGEITDNLFTSAKREGMPYEATAKLANLFLYDIDFQREIFAGDKFEAVFEAYYNDSGELVKTGEILYGRMTWRGGRNNRGYYLYEQGKKIDWFDAAGESARRFLMKTVIEGARISSGFGVRRHPISGYSKAHKGVDFAARRGTPIMAAGDGVVVRANWFSTYGRYVKIRHANGFETAYAHLNGFGKGIKAGAHVRQGQIIAYVGTTGASTGPHLHYEVLKNGKQVNPLTLKVADGKKLSGDAYKAFSEERDWINRLRPQGPRIRQLARLN